MRGTNTKESAAPGPSRCEAITLNGRATVPVRLPSAIRAPDVDAAARAPAIAPDLNSSRFTLQGSSGRGSTQVIDGQKKPRENRGVLFFASQTDWLSCQ